MEDTDAIIAKDCLKPKSWCEEKKAGWFMHDHEKVEGFLEIVSLSGNITTLEKKPLVHAHADGKNHMFSQYPYKSFSS